MVNVFLYRSTSESEESDDQVAWALKRRHIKLALSPPQDNNHSTHRTDEGGEGATASCHGSHSAAELHHAPSSREQGESEREDCATPTNVLSHMRSNGSQQVKECKNGIQEEHIEAPINVNSPTELSEPVLPSIASSDFHSESVSSDHDGTRTEMQQQTAQRGQYHRTDSLTLSSELSSFSEGELSPTKLPRSVTGASSPMPTEKNDEGEETNKSGTKKSRKKRKSRGGKSGQGNVSERTQVTDDISSPETVRAELAAKQGRKEEGKKKKKKGDKKKEGGQSTKKSNSTAKKCSSMRIRLDSLTTSSDEERLVDSPRLSRVEEVLEPPPAKDDLKEIGESEERLRQRLEHKILSKKPPSTFETPATEPLFHRVYNMIHQSH